MKTCDRGSKKFANKFSIDAREKFESDYTNATNIDEFRDFVSKYTDMLCFAVFGRHELLARGAISETVQGEEFSIAKVALCRGIFVRVSKRTWEFVENI